jgi:hypothetical protein
MPSLIPPPLVFASGPEVSNLTMVSFIFPTFLCSVNSQITYYYKGVYHKGFLTWKLCGMYCLSFETHFKKKSKDWGINLQSLPFNWVDLCTEGILLPGHVAHSFIWISSPSLSSPSPDPPPMFDPVAKIVSVVNLHQDCPSTLIQSLATFHQDR